MKYIRNSILIILLVIPSMSIQALSIDKMKSDAQRYSGDIVRLRGEVAFVAKIPFTDLYIYTLEDKTGKVLVFSAFEKELDERVSIRAEVVAYSGEDNEKGREETIDRISDYLIEKEILEHDGARRISEISLRFINSAADAVSGVWFVIEQEKRGFFNL